MRIEIDMDAYYEVQNGDERFYLPGISRVATVYKGFGGWSLCKDYYCGWPKSAVKVSIPPDVYEFIRNCSGCSIYGGHEHAQTLHTLTC